MKFKKKNSLFSSPALVDTIFISLLLLSLFSVVLGLCLATAVATPTPPILIASVSLLGSGFLLGVVSLSVLAAKGKRYTDL